MSDIEIGLVNEYEEGRTVRFLRRAGALLNKNALLNAFFSVDDDDEENDIETLRQDAIIFLTGVAKEEEFRERLSIYINDCVLNSDGPFEALQVFCENNVKKLWPEELLSCGIYSPLSLRHEMTIDFENEKEVHLTNMELSLVWPLNFEIVDVLSTVRKVDTFVVKTNVKHLAEYGISACKDERVDILRLEPPPGLLRNSALAYYASELDNQRVKSLFVREDDNYKTLYASPDFELLCLSAKLPYVRIGRYIRIHKSFHAKALDFLEDLNSIHTSDITVSLETFERSTHTSLKVRARLEYILK